MTTRWPTVALAVVCVGVVVANVAALVAGVVAPDVAPVVAVVVGSVACFAGFTAVHDASHRAVSHHVVVNEGVGHLAALLLLGPFLPYRFLHLEHHRHTNVRGDDPDRWSAGPWWSLPLRWLSQDVGYLWFFSKHIGARPRAEVVDLVVVGVALVAVGAASVVVGAFDAVVFGWWLPARVALFLLAFSFDWLPHAPHIAVDRHRATVVRSGRLWTLLLLGQNFHLVHHLDPAAPFFALPRLWRERRDALVARGAVDRSA